jgi:hypothetical protein
LDLSPVAPNSSNALIAASTAINGSNRKKLSPPCKSARARKSPISGAGGGYFTFKPAAAAGPDRKSLMPSTSIERDGRAHQQPSAKDSVKNVETILPLKSMTRSCRKKASISYSPATRTIT